MKDTRALRPITKVTDDGLAGYAIVELFGHVRLIGEVTEIEAFGGKLGRVESLAPDLSTHTRYFSAAAVYQITPITRSEAVAMVTPPAPTPRTETPAGKLEEYDPFAE